ncbi:MAG: hypothetical protein GWQ05_05160 [Verrucomicrobiaceae bacterium]|nr:hypothetical protein [Verrucomicrobiaceae bacterium]NCF90334.1 hypothetical protein [Verrucomicrobiaceae bacterium]
MICFTLHHLLTDASTTKPLIDTKAPLTLKQCRLEQQWSKPGSPSPFPTTIFATADVTLSHTIIESANGCAIFSKLVPNSPDEVRIRLENCAIAAVRAFCLMSLEAQKTWNITQSHCQLINGGLFCIDEKNQSVPQWKLKRSVIESAFMLMVRSEWYLY